MPSLTSSPRPPAWQPPPVALDLIADSAVDWLEAACLGGKLPPAVQWEIEAAGAAYRDAEQAEAHLQRAYLLAPEHPAVHIALYRFYFYKNRLPEALAVAERCLLKAARDNALPLDWQLVAPRHLDFSTYAALPRFYLFTLKACAYLNMRLGQLDQGAALVAKLIELDPADRLGGKVLLGVLARVGQEDED
jgi:tetratricopeptide (TPR) repeat protein